MAVALRRSCLMTSSLISTVSGSYEIDAMRYGRESVMTEKMVLNASLESTGVLVASEIGLLLGTATMMVVGS